MAIFASNLAPASTDRTLGSAVIERSLRFNRSDDPQLQRTATTTSNTFTYSTWVKRSSFSTFQYLLSIGGQGLLFNTDDTIRVYTDSGANASTGKFRDTSSWYHVVLSMNSGSATVYVNNVTHLSSVSGFSLSTSTNYLKVGWLLGDPGQFNLDGYLAETQLIDGSALTPSSFGFTDGQTGIWMPKRYEGSYGTSGFRLDYSDNSSTSALGIDKSPNGNDFTVNNFSVSSGDGNDSRTDTPTLRKATLNSITGWSSNATLKNGALEMTGSAGFKEISTIAIDGTSKLYYELVRTNAAGWQLVGIFIGQPNNPSNALTNSAIWGFASTQAQYFGGTYTSTGNVPGWSTNNVMGIKYENGTLKLYKDGTLATSNATGIPTDDIIFAYIANDNTNAASFVRFDSDSWTQATAAGVDSTWELSGKNLPPNVPSIVRPKRHFDTLLYTGTGSSNIVEGLEFSPDMIWVKGRDTNGTEHAIIDSVRGGTKSVVPNSTDAESTHGGRSMTFYPGGVRWNSDSNTCNANGENYALWCWKGGGSSNTFNVDGTGYATAAAAGITDGNVAITGASVNRKNGFSVVTYTGSTASGALTVGHGLNKKPAWVIIKRRDATSDWIIGHQGFATNAFENNKFLKFTNETIFTNSLVWGAEPTTTVTQIVSNGAGGAANLTSSGTYVMYSWAEIPGYSKFGSYTGNGSSDGTFVHTGFRPAFIVVKNLNTVKHWGMYDDKRAGYNVENYALFPSDASAAEDTSDYIDLLSNGFKLRSSALFQNKSGDKFIYAAFAEQPGEIPFETFANAR